MPLVLMFAFCLSCLLSQTLLAQDETQTRSITSDDFAKKRPERTSARRSGGAAARRRRAAAARARYRLKAKRKAAIRRKRANAAAKAAVPKSGGVLSGSTVVEMGMTMWRMRPPLIKEIGHRLPVQLSDGSQVLWIPERVDLDTSFAAGDRVRLAIESSVPGFLYIINSEIYRDGSYGDPFLIFPSENEDNSVQPGMLVDIPDQTDQLPYFLINPKGENYAGELLTVIISPLPLENLSTDQSGKIDVIDSLIGLEESSDAEIFSRTDMRDKIYSNAEALSACGSKSRQLLREKNSKLPCGAKTRQLSREEPMPQTIYRIRTAAGKPAVSFIRLEVGG